MGRPVPLLEGRSVTFEALSIPDAYRIHSPGSHDERGWFDRVYCSREFRDRGLPEQMVQTSLSFNRSRATLRGLHWQAAPADEGKLVRCVRGRLFDVIADVRPNSATRSRWVSVELADDDGCAVWIPPGVAHGFETLEDETLVLYHMSGCFSPGSARRARWDDPRIGVEWPVSPVVMSDEDRDSAGDPW